MNARLIISAAALMTIIAAVAAPVRAADMVRIGKATGTSWTFTELDVGKQKGILAKYGVSVEIANFAGDAKLQQRV